MQPIFTTYEKAIIKITKRREKGRKKLVLWIYFTFYFYTVDWGGNFSKVSKKFSVGEKSDLQNQHTFKIRDYPKSINWNNQRGWLS